MLAEVEASKRPMRARVLTVVVVCVSGIAVTLAARSAMAPLEPTRPRVPVLVELFTSEGCSSCPSADTLLRQLDARQPVDGAEIVVLSEHVDYWNRLGWTDPFSSPAFTARQEAYSSALRAQGLYTPQAVIDGGAEVIGNDQPALVAAVRSAAALAKTALKVHVVPVGDERLRVAVTSGVPLPAGPATVVLALAQTDLVVKVPRGENAHKTLRHTGVVRLLAQSDVTGGGTLAPISFDVALDSAWPRDALRVVAFAHTGRQGRVVAIGTAAVPSAGR